MLIGSTLYNPLSAKLLAACGFMNIYSLIKQAANILLLKSNISQHSSFQKCLKRFFSLEQLVWNISAL